MKYGHRIFATSKSLALSIWEGRGFSCWVCKKILGDYIWGDEDIKKGVFCICAVNRGDNALKNDPAVSPLHFYKVVYFRRNE